MSASANSSVSGNGPYGPSDASYDLLGSSAVCVSAAVTYWTQQCDKLSGNGTLLPQCKCVAQPFASLPATVAVKTVADCLFAMTGACWPAGQFPLYDTNRLHQVRVDCPVRVDVCHVSPCRHPLFAVVVRLL
jgi:hypothetical protein